MSEYIITTKQIEELNRANCGMQIVTSWLSAYAIFDTSGFPPLMKSQHLAITLPGIVRCRDCKRMRDWTEEEELASYGKEELADGRCMFFRIGTYDDFFCAWGERGEE